MGSTMRLSRTIRLRFSAPVDSFHGLVIPLETAKPGAVIVLAAFGQGCDVLVLRATERITQHRPAQGCSRALASGVADHEYVRYLANGFRVARD